MPPLHLLTQRRHSISINATPPLLLACVGTIAAPVLALPLLLAPPPLLLAPPPLLLAPPPLLWAPLPLLLAPLPLLLAPSPLLWWPVGTCHPHHQQTCTLQSKVLHVAQLIVLRAPMCAPCARSIQQGRVRFSCRCQYALCVRGVVVG